MQRLPEPVDQVELKVRDAQIALLYAQAPTGIFVNVFLGTLILLISYRHAPIIALAWYLALVLVTGARWLLLRAYRAVGRDGGSSEPWGQRHVLGTFAAGCVWAALAFVLLPHLPLVEQLIATMGAVGIVSGAVAVNSAVLTALKVFLFPIIGAFALRFLLWPEPMGVVIALMALLLGGAMLVTGRQFYRATRESLASAFHIEALNHALLQAHHDPLTKLPGRALLLDRLEHALRHADRNRKFLAVLFVDVNKLKQYNDAHGHHIGDLVLQGISASLEEALRAEDTVARYSGDEFLVLLNDLAKPEDAGAIAQKLLANVAKFTRVENIAISPSVSVGIAIYPRDATQAEQLVKLADQAMYYAKHDGESDYAFYAAVQQHLATLQPAPR